MQTSFGYTDSVSATKSVAIPTLSYANDFVVIKDTPSECILSNTTSPIDQAETIRFAITNVANVYNGTQIEPSVVAVTKRGVSLVVQINDILRLTEETDSTCCGTPEQMLPISTHIVVKIPINQYVTADTAMQVIKRNISALFDTEGVTNARLNAMLRGALKPSTM